MLSDARIRLWTSAPRDVSLAARGDFVVLARSTPSSDGRRRIHRLFVLQGGRVEPVSPPSWDCREPVVAEPLHPDHPPPVLCLTDQGEPGSPRQVAARQPNGEWRVLSDASGGVVSFRSGAHRVVAVERVRSSDEPWGSEVAVTEDPLIRHWDRWLTEDLLQIVVYDRLTGARTPLDVPAPRGLEDCAMAVSPEGRSLAYTRRRIGRDGVLERTLMVRSLPGGGRGHIIGDRALCDHSHPVFAPDGRGLAFVRHRRSRTSHGRRQLWMVDGSTGDQLPLGSSFPHWIEPHAWTDDGIIGLVTIGDYRRVVRVRPADDHVKLLDEAERSWDSLCGSDALVGLSSSLVARPQVRVVGGGAIGLSPASVDLPAVSHFSVRRGASVCPAMWLPTRAEGPRPVLVLVHGGPVSAWRDEWHPRLAAAGFASLDAHIVLANPRGSLGRGDDYIEGIWHQWSVAIGDLVALLHQVAEDPRVDPDRIALLGGSFGGWAVNRLATRIDAPPLCAVVSHAGIFDHTAMYGACDEPGAFAWHLGGRPHLLRDKLLADDPSQHVVDWNAPALITHGARDHNVPVGQALALHTALLDQGVSSRLVVFPGEGHHILEPRNEVRWWREVLTFLDRHFSPDAVPDLELDLDSDLGFSLGGELDSMDEQE